MKSIKLALLGGAAIAVTAAAAHADDLDTLKAQIETLNARVAAMESAPAVPAGYQLLAISEGDLQQVPGLEMSARDRAALGSKSTIISVMPTADAPAGTTISWSGYVRAGLVYNGDNKELTVKHSDTHEDGHWTDFEKVVDYSNDTSDTDVKARGQLRVVGTTDTAVGEVGVTLKMRADLNGNGGSDVYMKEAWGYWAMTPELTLGGGYSGSLGNIGYGYDGACTCYYTDNADVDFNPGDVTQFRLSYGSGPFSMAVALEDASLSENSDNYDSYSGDKLGVSGEIKYSGDTVSGEIAGVWRDRDENSDAGISDLWQVGAGLGFTLGDMASLSLAAAMGEGPYQTVDSSGDITSSYAINNQWWGVSALASFNMTDVVHAEIAAGYKNRQGDDVNDTYAAVKSKCGTTKVGKNGTCFTDSEGIDYNTYAVLAGVYYNPVDQLTIGIEGEWYTKDVSYEQTSGHYDGKDKDATDYAKVDFTDENFTVDLVSVWRF